MKVDIQEHKLDSEVYFIDGEIKETKNLCKTCKGKGSLKFKGLDLYGKCPNCSNGYIIDRVTVPKVCSSTIQKKTLIIVNHSDDKSYINEDEPYTNPDMIMQYSIRGMPNSFYFYDIPHYSLLASEKEAYEILNNKEKLDKYIRNLWRLK